MFRSARIAHRSVVPIAALPLLLTTLTGILFSLLDSAGIESELLLDLHHGKFGPLNLAGVYPLVLGVCVLLLMGSGVRLWLQGRRGRKAG